VNPRPLLGAALGLALTVSTSIAAAREKYRLEYTLAPGVDMCAGAEDFEAAVGAVLLSKGEPPFDPDAKGKLSVKIRREGATLWASISLEDAKGRVQTTDPVHDPVRRCDQLLADAAFAAAMLMEPVGPSAPEEPPKEAPAPVCPPPEPCNCPPAIPAAAPRAIARPARPASTTPPRALMLAGVGLDWGMTPGLGPSLSLGAGLRWRSFSMAVEGRFSRGWENLRIAPSEREIGGTTISGLVAPCAHRPLSGRLQLDGCAVVALGWVAPHVSGPNLRNPEFERSAVLFSAGLRTGLGFLADDRFALRAQGEALLVPLASRMFVQGREVWSTSHLALSAQIVAVSYFDLF